MPNLDASLPDLSPYPPAPVLWLTHSVDTICTVLRVCTNWRDTLGITPDHPHLSYLHAKVPSLSASLPPLLTFDEFRSLPEQHGVPWWSAAWHYVAHTPSTALGDLSTPTALTALIALVLILRTCKAVLLPLFCRLGRMAASRTHGSKWIQRHPERIAKFGEYVFRLLYHTSISILGMRWFWKEPWWQFHTTSVESQQAATLHLFSGFPYHPVTPQMSFYYLLQAAYNLDALVSLLELSLVWESSHNGGRRRHFPFGWGQLQWSSNVRGDFVEMLLHHVITNLLVIGSSKCRLTRIGSMVFLLHDLSDVPVDLSKLFNFVKYQALTVTCFCMMVGVWCWTRLYWLPMVVYRAVLTQSHYVTQHGLPPLLYLVYRHPFYVLVGFLIVLHVIWFGMFLQIFYSIIVKRKVQDLSEHKQGEQYDGDENEDEQRGGNNKSNDDDDDEDGSQNANHHGSGIAVPDRDQHRNYEEKKDE